MLYVAGYCSGYCQRHSFLILVLLPASKSWKRLSNHPMRSSKNVSTLANLVALSLLVVRGAVQVRHCRGEECIFGRCPCDLQRQHLLLARSELRQKNISDNKNKARTHLALQYMYISWPLLDMVDSLAPCLYFFFFFEEI